MGSVSVQIVAAVVTFLSFGLGVTAVVTRYWFQLRADNFVVADYGLWEVCASDENHTVCRSFASGGGFWIRVAQFDGVVYILFAVGAAIATCVWIYRASFGMEIVREPRFALAFSILTVVFIAKTCVVLFMLSATVKSSLGQVLASAGLFVSFSQSLGLSCVLAVVAIVGHIVALIFLGVALARRKESTQLQMKTFS